MKGQDGEKAYPVKKEKKHHKKDKGIEKLKNKRQQDEEKVLRIEEERERRYERLQEEKAKGKEEHPGERNRLAEAMLMAEIIGMPVCKTRHTSNNKRSNNHF